MNELDIFSSALELGVEQRESYLQEACRGNAALRLKIEALLRSSSHVDSFLESSAIAEAGVPVDRAMKEGSGTRIGPYKLLEQIGEGGFGVVYMAEQKVPVQRRVALKIIKPGMDSRRVLARFEAERQALAMMEHPNVAKVLDAGATEAGRPYFVMELVKGIPITDYCDEHELTPRDRLQLFLGVCQAVQHAHQKGVIHRDIKPTNILVAEYDERAVPKVIDFGVAKAVSQPLTEKSLFTELGQLIGTLEYMSPEQAKLNQLDIDTRSDIYSLGVLLYELLTGTTPLDRERLRAAAFDEMLCIIREEEPPNPSTRITKTRSARNGASANRRAWSVPSLAPRWNELDWIVMKCLEKDRARRYESASSLATDVERYLDDEPVQACPPTVAYRLQRFYRRNRAALVSAALVAATLVAGLMFTTWQAVRATRAEAEANANAAAAHANEQEATQQRDQIRSLNDDLRHTLYMAHMNMAKRAWDEGGSDRTLELLERHRPELGQLDYRDFEWHYLNRLCHLDLLTLSADSTNINGIAYRPHRNELAAALQTKLVVVWDARTGGRRFTLTGHTQPVAAVAYSADGSLLASGSGGSDQGRWLPGEIKVWNADTGEELVTIADAGQVRSVAFTPDGRRLAGGHKQGVKIWDAQSGALLRDITQPLGEVHSVAFGKNSRRLAIGGGHGSHDDAGQFTIWDTETGRMLLDIPGHTAHVVGVAYSPDGSRLASASWDHTVRIWDAESGRERLTFKGHNGIAVSAVFSPDGQRIASSSMDAVIKLWNPDNGAEHHAIQGYSGSLAFSPDGTRLASISGKSLKVWDATQSPESRTLREPSGPIIGVAFDPTGQRVATAGGPFTRLWDVTSGNEVLTIEHPDVKPGFRTFATAFSPDGKHVATGGALQYDENGGQRGAALAIWDAGTGREIHRLIGHADAVMDLAFSPDGRRLATASFDKTVRLWDVKTGEETFTFRGHDRFLHCVAFSPDGKWIASGGQKAKIIVWDAETGETMRTIDAMSNGLAFSPDGTRLASASAEPPVKIWDVSTGKELLRLKGPGSGGDKVAFSPNGSRLATASASHTVKLWDAQTGEELLALKGHSEWIRMVAFSPDGHRLASGAMDGVAKIWDATPVGERTK